MRRLAFIALFLGSAVMFSIEPMLAKMMLPHMGGGASVWTSCLVFFQGTLLAGYVLAHLAVRRFGTRGQAALVVLLLALGFAFLPTTLRLATTGAPVTDVVLTLMLSAGVPFLALSMLAPSIQRWSLEVPPTQGETPYPLYAASNAGSLISLVAYTTLVEPRLGLRVQSRLLTIGYALLLVLVVACAVPLLRRGVRGPSAPEAARTEREPVLGWVVLSTVPAAYLAAVTAHVTTEILPVPLLWAVPLALYLLTFVLVFGGAEWAIDAATHALPVFAAAVTVVMIAQIRHPAWMVASIHMATFFVAALVCHGRLARARPRPARLTAYFAWLGAGGFLGSVAVALVAPLVFDQYLEYPLLLFMVLALRPRTGRSRVALDVAYAGMVGAAALGSMLLSSKLGLEGIKAMACFPGIPAAAALVAMQSPRRFAFAIAALLGVAGVYTGAGRTLWRSRDYYGTLRVARGAAYVELTNGTTVHGRQAVDPKRRPLPLGYYTENGPFGDIFRMARSNGATERVFVVGLGSGATAAYALPGERWTFFEIDPDVVTVAKNENLFSYLGATSATVVVGDARKELERASDQAGLLVVDAFTSDAIPTHLMTLEAAELYARKADIVAWHVSNRFLDLTPILARLAERIGWVSAMRIDTVLSNEDVAEGKSASKWVLFVRGREYLAGIMPPWEFLVATEGPVWTDDRSSVVDVLTSSQPEL